MTHLEKQRRSAWNKMHVIKYSITIGTGTIRQGSSQRNMKQFCASEKNTFR